MSNSDPPVKLSHVGPDGDARMVDVSGKDVTVRQAMATGMVTMKSDVLDALLRGDLPKGEALATARIAGTMAAKKTAEWIPMCHPLPLDWVRIEFDRQDAQSLCIRCTTKTTARTGVEMEALTAVSAAALTLYDMAKAADKEIVIGPIQLERKTGGKSGDFVRST